MKLRACPGPLARCCGLPGCGSCSDFHEQTNRNGQTLPPKDKPVSRRRGLTTLAVGGLICISLAYMIILIEPRELMIQSMLTLKEGSWIFKLWKDPPVAIYVKVYVFNVTNKERFLKGEEKLRVEEVGPYVYREYNKMTNITFNANSTVSFIQRTHLTFVPEMSIGDEDDAVIVPNIPVVAASSFLRNSSIFTQAAFSVLLTRYKLEAIQSRTIKEFLWGGDDPLVALVNKFLPKWITFKSFGILDRIYASGDEVITIANGRSHNMRPFLIDKFAGLDGSTRWSGDYCNNLKMATVGPMFQPNLQRNESIYYYRHSFCRKMVGTYLGDVVKQGIPGFKYRASKDTMDNGVLNPENVCYCVKNEGCLPEGVTSVSPCLAGLPGTVSFPHFMDADPKISEKVEGLKPNRSIHTSLAIVQPELGIPLEIHLKVQLNIDVRKSKYIKRTSVIGDMFMPAAWIDMGFDKIPESINNILYLGVVVCPMLEKGVTYGLFCLGGVMFLTAAIASVCRRSPRITLRYQIPEMLPMMSLKERPENPGPHDPE